MKAFCAWLCVLVVILGCRDHSVLAAGKNLLVFGGNGFIGSSVVVKLLEDDNTGR